jgi:ring-1,2-phenylacetyl-CoA epoxidase subunit PaaD
VPLTLNPSLAGVTCPACGSANTQRTAAFSGTACKDLYRCLVCAEPFEHVKEI